MTELGWNQLENGLKEVKTSVSSIPQDRGTGWTEEATNSIEEMIKALLAIAPLEVEISIIKKLHSEL